MAKLKTIGRKPWRLSAKLLIASSVATVIGFSTICASVLLDMRRGEQELARQTLENLASTINADISRNVELYDQSLRAVASSQSDSDPRRAIADVTAAYSESLW